MSRNPETVVTTRIRRELEKRGVHFIKLSDTFTRGVPDSVLGVPEGIVMVEFKVDRQPKGPPQRSYAALGLSGAQDHHIKRLTRQANRRTTYVVTDIVAGGLFKAWAPDAPMAEPDGMYTVCANSLEEFLEQLGYRRG